MITEEMVKIYKKFNGDIDSWVRMGSKKQLALMNDGDWALIDCLIQDITLVNKGLASIDFGNNLSRRLVENCDKAETINQLKELAAQ